MGRNATSSNGLLLGVLATMVACSAGDHSTTFVTNSGQGGTAGKSSPGGLSVGGLNAADAGVPHACAGLQCQQTTCTLGACKQKPCSAGAKTTVSGTVYDPAGKVPLYNVIVYVPNGPVQPIAQGATCDRCNASALNPVTSALTDTSGHFVLNDVPVGSNIPLVIQVGKWRRQVKLPQVTACTDTPITDKEQSRLPRSQSEGDVPLIAITTGGADSMECLPLRMGLDPSEFSTETGKGRVHLYHGFDGQNNMTPVQGTSAFDATSGGAMLTPADTLWSSLDNLKKYDIVILSCEGQANLDHKTTAARQALYDYESAGGRVFASHWHHVWFSSGPAPLPTIATWLRNQAPDPPAMTIGTINTTFPKGKALSEWLVNVMASTTPGQLTINNGKDNVSAVDPMFATSWITIQNPNGTGGGRNVRQSQPHEVVEYLSFNAPAGAGDDQVCGRAVFSDLHVSASMGGDTPGAAFPGSCQMGDLSAQEKALEFMLFDLSSCVRKDDEPPEPPIR